MPVAKLLGTGTPDAMKVDEGTDSLDTFIRQAVGKEPFFSFSRTGDNPVQWIQFLTTMDQQELPGWPLLAPMKIQMQKCDKCGREFSSPINYRRHSRVHRRSLKLHKDPQKYRDLLGAFWDKLSYDEAKEIMSFKDVNLEEVPGSLIVRNILANMRKPVFLSLPQVYAKAGSALVDIIQGRPSRLPITSQELFSILDDASERTFLCAGTAESLQRYVFDGEASKIGLEMKNLIACTSFLVEQKLVKACLVDKDAEALRCQKLLVEEEEAAQKRQAVLLERKRQRKVRQKEQKLREQLNSVKVEIFETTSSLEAFSPPQSSAVEVNPYIPTSNNDNNDMNIEAAGGCTSDHSDSATCRTAATTTTEHQKVQKNNGFQHFVSRWQVPNSSQKGRRNNFHGDHNFKRVNGSSKVWTKKPKSVNGGVEVVKTRVVQNDAINQTDENDSQLMIGSISVIVRKSPGEQRKVDNHLSEIQENGKTNKEDDDQTLPTVSYHDSCDLNENDSKATKDSHPSMEFSIDAAKAFLAQRWKEATSGEHVKLVLSSSEPSNQPDAQNNHHPSESQERVILGSTENRLENMGVVGSDPTNGHVKPKFRTKPEKGMKTKYIPKPRHAS